MILKNYIVIEDKALEIEFEIHSDDNTILNITGLSGKFKVYLDIPGTDATYVIDKAITLVDAEKGLCKVTLLDTDTNINPAIYKYYLEITLDTNETKVFYQGSFTVRGEDSTRIQEIRDIYGLEFDNYNIQQGLNYAHTEMLKYAYEKQVLNIHTNSKILKIPNYVADANFDNIVDVDDIDILQYQKNTPYTVTSLNVNVSSSVFDHPNGNTLITMDNNYPSDGYTLQLTYYKVIDTFANLKPNINYIEELYVIIYLFKNLPVYKLQRGLKSRTINDVNIDFDQEGVSAAVKQFNNQLYNEIGKIKPIKITNVLIPKGYNRSNMNGW